VYKVETIGDAYMVVTGLPNPNPCHADAIAAFALDMMKAAAEVMSPVDNQPLKIRIGIHTGSVMAGVG
jgi:class 3 adenylate cyclase